MTKIQQLAFRTNSPVSVPFLLATSGMIRVLDLPWEIGSETILIIFYPVALGFIGNLFFNYFNMLFFLPLLAGFQ